MPKEWILNSAINRWGLQKKKMVGTVSDEIRKCSPKTIKDWEQYYYKKVYPKERLRDSYATITLMTVRFGEPVRTIHCTRSG